MLIFLICLNVLALSIFLMWYGEEKNNDDINIRAKQQSPWLNWFYPGDLSECDCIILEDN